MGDLSNWAGNSLGDLVRSKKKIPFDAATDVLNQIFAQADPARIEVESGRIDVAGKLAFAATDPIDEAEFCARSAYLATSLILGTPFQPSYLLDGLPILPDVPWTLSHALRCLSSPARTDRVGTIDSARRLLARVGPQSHPPEWPCFRGSSARTGTTSMGPPAARPAKLAMRWFRRQSEVIASPVLVRSSFLLFTTTTGVTLILDMENGSVVFESAVESPTESTFALDGDNAWYGSDDGNLRCFDLQRLRTAWKGRLAVSNIRSSPVLDGHNLYVGTIGGNNKGTLLCFDTSSRKSVWTYPCGPAYSSPTLLGGSVLIGSDDGCLHSVDSRTGKRNWLFKSDDKIRATAAAPDSIYFGTFGGTFYALNPDGSLKWKQTTGKRYYSSPACRDGLVICGSHDSNVYAFDAATGNIRWKYAAAGSVIASPVVAGTFAACATANGSVFILDLADGTPVALADIGQSIGAGPLWIRDSLYVGHKDGVTALALA